MLCTLSRAELEDVYPVPINNEFFIQLSTLVAKNAVASLAAAVFLFGRSFDLNRIAQDA